MMEQQAFYSSDTPIGKDWYITGALSGAGAAAAKAFVNRLLEKAGIPTICHSEMAARALMTKQHGVWGHRVPELTTWDWILGHVGNVALGSLFGAALAYVYTKTPPGHHTLKGALGGAWLWVTTMAVGARLGLIRTGRITPMSMSLAFLNSTIFGTIQGYIIGKNTQSVTTHPHPVLVGGWPISKHCAAEWPGGARSEGWRCSAVNL